MAVWVFALVVIRRRRRHVTKMVSADGSSAQVLAHQVEQQYPVWDLKLYGNFIECVSEEGPFQILV